MYYTCTVIYMLKTTRDYKLLKEVADVINDWGELQTVAIWLKRQPNIVSKLRNDNHSFSEVVYKVSAQSHQFPGHCSKT